MEESSELPVPKYYQLKMDIINKINSGILAEHDRLPSENELCRQYGVSRITVRKTFDELVTDKYIYKIQGKGTYVAPASNRRPVIGRQDYGCSEMIRRQGKHPTHRVLRQEISDCSELSAECLKLTPGEPALHYERIYYSDGAPLIYAKTVINQKYLPGIEKIDLSETTLSSVLHSQFGLTITRQNCVLRAIPADAEMSSALDVPENFPILYRAVVCMATDGVRTFPLETSQLYYRTDCMPYVI